MKPWGRTASLFWTMSLVPTLATAAFVARDWLRSEPIESSPKAERLASVSTARPAPKPARGEPENARSKAPVATAEPRFIPPHSAAAADESATPSMSDFDKLTERWVGEGSDRAWTFDVQKIVGNALAGANLPSAILREADCRQTVCRLIVEANEVAGMIVQGALAAENLPVAYARERGNDVNQFVAFMERGGAGMAGIGN